MVRKAMDIRSNRLTGVDYFKNPPKLFKAIENHEWAKAKEIGNDDSSEACQWVVNKDEDGTVLWRRLPLHEACMNEPTEAIVKMLLLAYPRAVRSVDLSGRIPLHHACAYGASERIVELLLFEYPESIDVADEAGDTPIMIVQNNGKPNKGKIIEALERRPHYYTLKASETKKKGIEENQLKAYAAAFEKRFKAVKMKNSAVVSGLEELVGQLRDQILDLEKELKMSEEQRKKEVEELRVQSEQMRKNVRESSALETRMSTVSSESEPRDEVMEAPMGDYELLERQREEDLNTIDNMKKTEAALQMVIEEITTERNNMKKSLLSYEKESKETSVALKSLDDELRDVKASYFSAQEKIVHLENELNVLRAEAEKNSILMEGKSDLEKEVNLLLMDNKQVTAKNTELESKIKEYSSEVTKLEATIITQSSRIDELGDEVEALSGAKAEYEAELKTHQEKLRALGDNNNEQEIELVKLKDQEAMNKKAINELQIAQEERIKVINELKELVANTSSELLTLKEKKASLLKEVEDKDIELVELRVVREQDRMEIEQLEKKVMDNIEGADGLKEENTRLGTLVKILEGQLDDASRKTLAMIEEQDVLEKMIENQFLLLSAAKDEYKKMMASATKQEESIRLAAKHHEKVMGSLDALTEDVDGPSLSKVDEE